MVRHVYRVGLGQTASGKILDRDTRSYLFAIDALNDALECMKPVFVSRNKKKYQPLTIGDLYRLAEEEEQEREEYLSRKIDKNVKGSLCQIIGTTNKK